MSICHRIILVVGIAGRKLTVGADAEVDIRIGVGCVDREGSLLLLLPVLANNQ
jgi:hypothetical protein